MNIMKALCETKMVLSRSEARRVISLGGCKVNGEEADLTTEVEPGDEIKVGKHKRVKVGENADHTDLD